MRVIATAGSGKTFTSMAHVAYLLNKGVSPKDIILVTFSNAGAKEMAHKLKKILGYDPTSEDYGMTITTFHGLFYDIVKDNWKALGFGRRPGVLNMVQRYSKIAEILAQNPIMEWKGASFRNFSVKKGGYNDTGALSVISDIFSQIKAIGKDYATISSYEVKPLCDIPQSAIQKVIGLYGKYEEYCKKEGLIDFDDMELLAFQVIEENPKYLETRYGFRHSVIDEFQDTSEFQMEMVKRIKMLPTFESMMIVGDDDQSIYKFRGANIYNILNFEKEFPNAVTIKLEQNYRSTQNILNAANGVIANNVGRKAKRLWTENEEGEKIAFHQFETGFDEADYVAKDIRSKVREGMYHYGDCAVLYRTNAQSRLFEERFITASIPYKIVGGVNFYSRREIKDLLAYLKTIDNAMDDLAVRRIINVPKRGIGATTLSRVQDYADENGLTFYNALKMAEEIGTIGRASAKIRPFVMLIQSMRSKLPYISVSELLQEIIEETGYVRELEAENTEEAQQRMENIDELISKAVTYEESEEEPTLSGFLEEVALVADIDSVDETQDYVVLMTLHSAKGLEFPQVYLAGMEDGLFPGFGAICAENPTAEIEEERRLAYVGITRAKERLSISCARMRMIRGETQYNKVSRFVKEIPRELLAGTIQKEKMPDIPKPSMMAKNAFSAKPMALRRTGVPEARNFGNSAMKKPLDYAVGDTVSHLKFGTGVVKQIIDGGRDYEVTVDFSGVGVKKMFASFAKLKKL